VLHSLNAVCRLRGATRGIFTICYDIPGHCTRTHTHTHTHREREREREGGRETDVHAFQMMHDTERDGLIERRSQEPPILYSSIAC